MPKKFNLGTLEVFEAASASIPLRPLDRAFQGAAIRLGQDPGGPAGSRRTQFRRYVASVDQRDPQQLDRLGDALGALIEEVAPSKVDFLVKAAQRDGFVFVDGAFRPAESVPSSFAVTRLEEFASIDDLGRRLNLLANDSPADAIDGAHELVESVCRTVLGLIRAPVAAETADLVDVLKSTLEALERVSPVIDDAKKGAALVRRCLHELGAVVASLAELRSARGSGHGRGGRWKGLSPRHARLAVGAAVTLAGFVAETSADLAANNCE